MGLDKCVVTCIYLYCSGPQPFWHQGPVGFVEDNFSTDGGVGWDGSGGNVSDAEQQMKLGSLTSHSPPAVRTGTGLWPGGWGPLLYGIIQTSCTA